MKFVVLSESSRRIRIRAANYAMSFRDADRLEYFLRSVPGVTDAIVHERTGNAVIRTDGRSKDALFTALSRYDREKTKVLVPAHTGRKLYHELENKVFKETTGRIARRLIPVPVRNVLTVSRSVPKILTAAAKPGPRDLRLPAVAVSLLTGQIGTASSLMFADRMGTILKEWTVQRQADLLADRIQGGEEKVWTITEDGTEQEQEVRNLKDGEKIRLRSGNLVPADGVVDSGEVTVDQAELTGEHVPLVKTAGSYLYAGSVIESGECVLAVEKSAGEGRYDRIVKMLRDSGRLTPGPESLGGPDTRPVTGIFLLAGVVTGLLTRDPSRILPFMLADYTHTINAALPAAVIAGMREAGEQGIVIKSGPALLQLRQADTILFNKRGILTAGKPSVVRIDCFNGFKEENVLAAAACLEEHYPHSMADAVVEEAGKRGLLHEERHTKVEYVASHGIVSVLDGERVVIGSKHFVVDDEHVVIPEAELEKYRALLPEHSHLYMAVGGRLAAVISLEDPLRQNVTETIRKLRNAGFNKIVLMTGDSEHAARRAAAQAGFDAYTSGASAEDKEVFIEKERREGRVTVMIGDGINDVPALRAADIGIALETSVPLAAKNADILIREGDLEAILKLKTLSEEIGRRVKNTKKAVAPAGVFFGTIGAAGILSTNAVALAVSGISFLTVLHSMTNLLNRKSLLPDMRSAAAVLIARDMADSEENGEVIRSSEILSELGVLPL